MTHFHFQLAVVDQFDLYLWNLQYDPWDLDHSSYLTSTSSHPEPSDPHFLESQDPSLLYLSAEEVREVERPTDHVSEPSKSTGRGDRPSGGRGYDDGTVSSRRNEERTQV